MKIVLEKLDYLFWLWILALFVGAQIPGMGISHAEIGRFSFRADYLLHVIAFFGIVSIFALARRHDILIFKEYGWLKLIALCIGLGVSIELIQYFIPGRAFNQYDLLSNLVGFTAGLIFFRLPALLKA